ncbi:MAG TPA: molecular chaperone HtpG [Polyangiaceae bacterium]|nr:molecular chaperone HtpG [Polyangiaceae bacterium]
MTDPTSPPDKAQELPFQAEVQQLLHLVVHSLYTNREVFLRELIANASDALDKARYLGLTDKSVAERTGPPEISLAVDREARTLTIEDNGIGMTRDEIIANLGTIARSGTLEFVKRARAAGTADPGSLIGQFGVGFYSAFVVADRVDVESRSAADPNAEPVLWRSAGTGSFTVLPGERERPGTRITVHLQAGNDDLLEDWRIESLVKKYSDFVSHPIKLKDKLVNSTSALWLRPKSEITEEQYDEFYQHVLGGFGKDKPLARMHVSADAPIQFHALLFVPDKPPLDMMLDTPKRGIRLHARRIFVMDGCEKLTPPYLRFLRGVVDSEDLSLNVSREMLQDDRALEQIQKQLTRNTLKTLQQMADSEPEKYEKFWDGFGRMLRLGVSSDPGNREAVAKLLRYPSTRTEGDEKVSLDQYVARMAEGQKSIYYLTGPSLQAVRNSPHLEVFRRKDVEVLLMSDPVDEWVVGALTEFGGKPLESVAHGEVDLEGVGKIPEQTPPAVDQDRVGKCLAAIKVALGDRVKDVRLSKRLTESASCLVSEEGDIGANMERVMRLLDREVEAPKRILEINGDHPFVQNLTAMVESETGADRVQVFAELLLDQALLAEGMVPDPSGLLKRMQQIMTLASKAPSGEPS